MKKFLTKVLMLLFVMLVTISFASCGTGGASKGYKIRQQEISEFYIGLGGTGDEVDYTSCTYVSVVREESKTVYFYEAYYTLTIGSNSMSNVEYFAWIEGNSYTDDSSRIAFQLAYKEVNNGSANGKIGTL